MPPPVHQMTIIASPRTGHPAPMARQKCIITAILLSLLNTPTPYNCIVYIIVIFVSVARTLSPVDHTKKKFFSLYKIYD